jgi:hypothetical protein
MGYNYWSPVYSPYWAMPVYLDPWFYSPYRPGFSISFGYGWGGPYWSSSWGMCNWYGYNTFSYWNNPYSYGWGAYGYGYNYGYGGYNNGYWNGYYDGLNTRNNSYNYGPRRSYNSNVAYGRTSSGVRTNPTSNGGYVRREANAGSNNNGGYRRREMSTTGVPNNNNEVRIDNSSRRVRSFENNGGATQVAPSRESSAPTRNYNSTRQVEPQRQVSPQRNMDVQRSTPQPSRSYSAPAPSRSYSAPSAPSAPSRSFSAPSGGNSGGGRSGGGSFRR